MGLLVSSIFISYRNKVTDRFVLNIFTNLIGGHYKLSNITIQLTSKTP